MRVTVIVPEALMEAASHVHVLLGKANHLTTYTVAGWQDAQGNLYAVSSGLWTEAQIAGVTDPAVLQSVIEEGRVPEGVDLALVAQAQAAFVLLVPDEDGAYPSPDPAKINGLAHDDPSAALAVLGLSRVEVSE